MRSAGYDVRETNPFAVSHFEAMPTGIAPHIVIRLRALWALARPIVLQEFPPPPGLPKDTNTYLRSEEEIYPADAYTSLSIEGYNVTPELIDRVRSGNWNPAGDEADRQQRDALAARGYWQAFHVVKSNVAEIVGGSSPGSLVKASHRYWYREPLPAIISMQDSAIIAGGNHDSINVLGFAAFRTAICLAGDGQL